MKLETIILNPKDNISSILKLYSGNALKLLLNPGVYNQKLEINIDNLIIEGIGDGKVIITHSDYANMILNGRIMALLEHQL